MTAQLIEIAIKNGCVGVFDQLAVIVKLNGSLDEQHTSMITCYFGCSLPYMLYRVKLVFRLLASKRQLMLEVGILSENQLMWFIYVKQYW